MSQWIEIYISSGFLLLMVVICVYITRFATIPLIREVIASARKRRLAKQKRAGN